MEHRELDHAALHVKDVAKSCEFYGARAGTAADPAAGV